MYSGKWAHKKRTKMLIGEIYRSAFYADNRRTFSEHSTVDRCWRMWQIRTFGLWLRCSEFELAKDKTFFVHHSRNRYFNVVWALKTVSVVSKMIETNDIERTTVEFCLTHRNERHQRSASSCVRTEMQHKWISSSIYAYIQSAELEWFPCAWKFVTKRRPDRCAAAAGCCCNMGKKTHPEQNKGE